jgi:ATP-dependent DNA ligase
MALIFRYPDSPILTGPAELLLIEKEEPGRHVAQFKWDGWRRPIYIDNGKINLFSKHDFQAKKQPPASLIEEIRALGFPDGTAFDAEWMGLRATSLLNGRHYLVIFDLLYFNGQWQGDIPYEQRYANLKTLFELHKAKAKVQTPNIELEPICELGFLEMFERSKTMPLTEGIVLKRRSSKLKGKFTDSADNGGWLKCKWRA